MLDEQGMNRMSTAKTLSKVLSVQELRYLIGLHFDFVRATQRRLQKQISKALGEPASENDESSALMARLCEFAADVIARRLKRNRRTVPLFAAKDMARFIPTMLDLLQRQQGKRLRADERRQLQCRLKALIAEYGQLGLLGNQAEAGAGSSYEQCWKWVGVVQEVAAERRISPEKAVATPGARDEITRRLSSKRQYTAAMRKKISSIEGRMKAYFNQLVQFAQVDEADKEAAVEVADVYRDFQRELQHQFKRASEAVKRVATRWLEEEVTRIY
ncbi:MAG: hypothetical protein WD278_14985 [Pirellulales bacterium]